MANNEVLYRGDELTLAPSLVASKNTIAGGKVLSGEACMCGDLALVAMSTAFAAGDFPGAIPLQPLGNNIPATDVLAFKCKGVFNLIVHPAAAVAPGARIYFDPATGILSDNAAKTHFGWYIPTGGLAVNLNLNVDTLAPVRLKH